jgi:hypothetical protein
MSKEIDNQPVGQLPIVTIETVHALGGSLAERDPNTVARDLIEKVRLENPVLYEAIVALSKEYIGQHAQESFIDGAATTYALLASQLTSGSMNQSI